MPPIVKNSEIAVATPISAAPATTVAKTKDESPARPQPVALEIPVTVNGARTVEGSDKREPFSENTKTVLVFSHGAVIRLASTLSPGQLIFLTNEKTKKEVVCQVIKSKNYRSVTGYVELEFTEPAIGYWGMRFPTERTVSAGPVPALAPALPRGVVPAVPVSPKFASTPPQAPPVAAKPAAPISPLPAVLAPVKLVVSPVPKPAAPISAAPVKIVAPPPAPPAIAPVAEHPVTVAPAVPSSPPQRVAAKPEPVSTKRGSLPLPAPDFAAAISALFDSPVASGAKPAAAEPPKIEAATAPAESSTEQLKLQTARLQEQLGSLLFTETPAKLPSAPVPAGIAKTESPSPEVADKLLQFAQAGLKPTAPPEIKLATPARNFVPPSLAAEQVKVPAWLAPLARESESTIAEPGALPELVPLSESLPGSLSSSAVSPADGFAESRRPQHSSTFGGQLLGESSAPTPAVASRSRKGLVISIAATLLLAAGVVWYMRQPDNLISSLLASKTAPAPTAKFSPAAVSPSTSRPTAPPAGVTRPAPVPASSPAIHSEPPVNASTTAVPAIPPAAKNPKTSARNTPPSKSPKSLLSVKSTLPLPLSIVPVILRRATKLSPPLTTINLPMRSPSSVWPLAIARNPSPLFPSAEISSKPACSSRLLPSIRQPPEPRTSRVKSKWTPSIDVNGNVSSVKIISGPGPAPPVGLGRRQAMEIRAGAVERQTHSGPRHRHPSFPRPITHHAFAHYGLLSPQAVISFRLLGLTQLDPTCVCRCTAAIQICIPFLRLAIPLRILATRPIGRSGGWVARRLSLPLGPSFRACASLTGRTMLQPRWSRAV